MTITGIMSVESTSRKSVLDSRTWKREKAYPAKQLRHDGGDPVQEREQRGC